jgi:hypothetical protein
VIVAEVKGRRENMGEQNQTSNSLRPVWAVLACLFVLGVFLWPRSFIGGGPGIMTGFEMNLRLIDGAKQQWAFAHGGNGASLTTKEDIAPYLGEFAGADGWLKPVAGEVYILRPLSNVPEAQLTREVEGRPKGTIIRFGSNGRLEYILPNNPK